MEIKTTLESYSKKASVITIGTFDGVHIGHQKIIERLTRIAKDKNLEAVVLTFFPHPRMVLQTDKSIKLINTIDEKSELLKSLGVNSLVIQEFTKDFSRLNALDFVRDILIEKLRTKHIIIGYDHRFGRNRTANIEDLKEFGQVYDFEITEITAQDIDEVTVSSTKIRKALKEGDIKTANSYLGYNYMLTGKVVKGLNLGESIGFPTANIHIPETYKLIPKKGAYVVKSNIEGQDVFGMMNIGDNPTIEGKEPTIEVHFFNFNQNIYNKTIAVSLLERIRDEQKFASVNDLKLQLQKDKETALTFIHKND